MSPKIVLRWRDKTDPTDNTPRPFAVPSGPRNAAGRTLWRCRPVESPIPNTRFTQPTPPDGSPRLMSSTEHIPVLPTEVLEHLAPVDGATVVDGTLGGGGHARLLAEAVGPGGRVIALDRDPAAVERTAEALRDLTNVTCIHSDYANLPEVVVELGVAKVDGILLDLGLSSDQLADRSRGFSFNADGPLDLRFDPTSGEPASKLIARLQRRPSGRLDLSVRRRTFQSSDRTTDCRAPARAADRNGRRPCRACAACGAKGQEPPH